MNISDLKQKLKEQDQKIEKYELILLKKYEEKQQLIRECEEILGLKNDDFLEKGNQVSVPKSSSPDLDIVNGLAQKRLNNRRKTIENLSSDLDLNDISKCITDIISDLGRTSPNPKGIYTYTMLTRLNCYKKWGQKENKCKTGNKLFRYCLDIGNEMGIWELDSKISQNPSIVNKVFEYNSQIFKGGKIGEVNQYRRFADSKSITGKYICYKITVEQNNSMKQHSRFDLKVQYKDKAL
jgi:hypothetical protein